MESIAILSSKKKRDSADVVANLRVLLWESTTKGTECYIGIGCFDLAFCCLPRITSPSHHIMDSPKYTPNLVALLAR